MKSMQLHVPYLASCSVDIYRAGSFSRRRNSLAIVSGSCRYDSLRRSLQNRCNHTLVQQMLISQSLQIPPHSGLHAVRWDFNQRHFHHDPSSSAVCADVGRWFSVLLFVLLNADTMASRDICTIVREGKSVQSDRVCGIVTLPSTES